MSNCSHHEKLLRLIAPVSFGSVLVDKAIFEGSALNLVESSVDFSDRSIKYRFDKFCGIFRHFHSLFNRMKGRFENCLILHCQYMEIYHRLNRTSQNNARRFRHYAIDHITVLIHTLMQIMFLMNGFIVRSEDAAETPAKHIDPNLFMAFCNENPVTNECTTIQSSLTSLCGIRVLRAGLLENTTTENSQLDIKQFDTTMASCRENLMNWFADSVDMIEMFQASVLTRVCVGYGPMKMEGGHIYNLNFVPNHKINGQNISISPHTVGTKMDLDYELINYNIENTLIVEANDCFVGSDILADQDYQAVVTKLVKQKLKYYEENATSLFMTNFEKHSNEMGQKIFEAENSGIYVDEKHLFWW